MSETRLEDNCSVARNLAMDTVCDVKRDWNPTIRQNHAVGHHVNTAGSSWRATQQYVHNSKLTTLRGFLLSLSGSVSNLVAAILFIALLK